MFCLRLDAEGFTTSGLFRDRRYRGQDIPGGFHVCRQRRQMPVGFSPVSGCRGETCIQKINRKLMGQTLALAQYGPSAGKLAAMMNEWRRRAPDRAGGG